MGWTTRKLGIQRRNTGVGLLSFDDASGSEREGEIRKGGFSFARLVHIFSYFFCDTISSTRRVAGTESSGTSLYQFFDERTS